MTKEVRRLFLAAVPAVLLSVGMASAPADAQPAKDFYKGKTMTFVVTAGAGGSYGLYGQVLARHWPKYIPGHPTIVLQYQGGSGGLKGSNYMQHVAPRDGTYICMPINTVPMRQFLRPSGVKYDIRQWNWIGKMAGIVGTLGVWHTTGVKTIADAGTKRVVIGATGRASTTTLFPKLMNSQLGTKFKIVLGYKGVATMDKAMVAGEIEGRSGSWASWIARKPQWIRDKKVYILMQVAEKRLPALADVPTLNELAKTDRQRAMFEFMTDSQEFGRSIFAPPGVPADRLALLRDSFEKAMKDPALVSELQSKGASVKPGSWREVRKLARRTAAVDRDVLNDLRKAVGIKVKGKGKGKARK